MKLLSVEMVGKHNIDVGSWVRYRGALKMQFDELDCAVLGFRNSRISKPEDLFEIRGIADETPIPNLTLYLDKVFSPDEVCYIHRRVDNAYKYLTCFANYYWQKGRGQWEWSDGPSCVIWAGHERKTDWAHSLLKHETSTEMKLLLEKFEKACLLVAPLSLDPALWYQFDFLEAKKKQARAEVSLKMALKKQDLLAEEIKNRGGIVPS